MARTRMVTRTINVTEYTVLTVNTSSKEVSSEVYNLGGLTVKPEKALELLKKSYETDYIKLVSITSTDVHEECYGMYETDFLHYAKRLDPTTRKLLDIGLEYDFSNDDIEEIEDEFEPSEDFNPTEE